MAEAAMEAADPGAAMEAADMAAMADTEAITAAGPAVPVDMEATAAAVVAAVGKLARKEHHPRPALSPAHTKTIISAGIRPRLPALLLAYLGIHFENISRWAQ